MAPPIANLTSPTSSQSASITSPPKRISRDKLTSNNSQLFIDPTGMFLSGILDFLAGSCRCALKHAWPILCTRLTALLPYVDPSSTMYDNKQGILTRGSSRKQPSKYSDYISLWCNYLVFTSSIAPSSNDVYSTTRNLDLSPSLGNSGSHEKDLNSDATVVQSPLTMSNILKMVVPLLRVESTEIQDATLLGLGHINAGAVKDLLEVTWTYKRSMRKKAEE